jgi:ubiquinone/menaquinone biosynthesis C-methylase UbiE
MERLTDVRELLDGPLDRPSTLDDHLRDLARLNRWLGGVALSAAAIDALAAHRPELTLLDVETRGADIPDGLIRRARNRRRQVHAVGIDSSPEVLAAAVRMQATADAVDGVELHVRGGGRLDYADRSFDVAHASLALHRLEPPAVVDLLREMGRVARLGVVINELDRTRLGWIGAWLLVHLGSGNRYTRHDVPLSVRRSYRPHEASAMLFAAGLRPVRTIRGAFRQRYAIAAVAAGSDGHPGAGEAPDPVGAGE